MDSFIFKYATLFCTLRLKLNESKQSNCRRKNLIILLLAFCETERMGQCNFNKMQLSTHANKNPLTTNELNKKQKRKLK